MILSKYPDKFIRYSDATDTSSLPERFTFPFYYEPHRLAVEAAETLQAHLKTQTDWVHDFGEPGAIRAEAIGKMFGVLVVKATDGTVGYLQAFSGKVADSNHLPGFVATVYDMLESDGYFMSESKVISALTLQLQEAEDDPDFADAKQNFEDVKLLADEKIIVGRQNLKDSKLARKAKREEARLTLSEADLKELEDQLAKESIQSRYYLKDLQRFYTEEVTKAKEHLATFENRVTDLRQQRKNTSIALQKWLFNQYTFLNAKGEDRSLYQIFTDDLGKVPPSAAGECAAPKLLQYAYENDLQPIALAEFWWGQSPRSAIRKQGTYYPSCRGKCEPILGHMLEGLEVDPNPINDEVVKVKDLRFLYEDEYIAVIEKPAEMLTVPGKTVNESAYTQLRERYPDVDTPLIIHRLDMSTSGLLVVGLEKKAHTYIQKQFISRKISKRYIAVLDGEVKEDKGYIDLPLRVDLDDRPRQLVCYEHGKMAKTRYEVINQANGKTRIYFYPITGRTHQLRVHAAHELGLGTPIIGDDLYGRKANRLHLHAERLTFEHPITRKKMTFQSDPNF